MSNYPFISGQNPFHPSYGNFSNQNSYSNSNTNNPSSWNPQSQYSNTHSTWNQNNNYSQFNQGQQNSSIYQNLNQFQPRTNQQYGYNEPSNNTGSGNILFADIAGSLGRTNISQQQGNHQGQQGKGNILGQVLSNMDWDTLLKDKNFSKQQADTTWVNYQEKSWLQPKPSTHIQEETDRKFAFPNPYIKYKIIPGVDQKKALDVTSKDELDKGLVRGNLIIWDYHGGPNQQFYIHKCADNQNEFMLINASTGFCVSAIHLTVNNKKLKGKDMTNHLCVYPKLDDSKAQKWRLVPLNKGGDVFKIESVATGKVLDCQNQSHSNGTNVIQWSSNNGKNQLWKILPA